MDLWPNENQRRLCIPSYKKLYKYSLNCVLFLTVILTWIFFLFLGNSQTGKMETTVVFLSANMQTSFLKESHLLSDRYMTKQLYLYFSQTRFLI